MHGIDSVTMSTLQRCWHDTDDMPPLNAPGLDPLLRPLNRGEVGVSFFPDNRREIRPETDFNLVDRFFQPGDVCKRDIHDVQSGVVASVDVQFQVAHVITNRVVDKWMSIKDVKAFTDIAVGDYVACDDWIGQVRKNAVGSRLWTAILKLSVAGARGATIALLQQITYADNEPQMFDESIVQVADGQLVRVPELSAHLTIGERGSVSLQCLVIFLDSRTTH